MKKTLTFFALSAVALISADQYNQPYANRGNCPTCNNGGGYYQNQPHNNYYQQNQGQSSQGYYQNEDRGYYPRNDQRDQRNQYGNQQSYQRQDSRSYDNNEQYNQNNQLDRNQQRNNDYSDRSGNNPNPRANSDQEISKEIRDTLSSGWFSKGFQGVSYDVSNGNVNLRGSVDTLENKNKVEDSVRKINGVRQVNNQITIASENTSNYSDSQLQDSERKHPNDSASTPQDRQLNAKIRDKLSDGWFSKGYETIVIRTTNGVVVISGNVDKEDDVQKINDQVKNIEGVKSVNNQLRLNNR